MSLPKWVIVGTIRSLSGGYCWYNTVVVWWVLFVLIVLALVTLFSGAFL